jgi:hypothetical protein
MTKQDDDRPAKRNPIRRLRIEDDEEVGYGKPPKAHRFKPGQSGNPGGRPKGVKNESTIMRELLGQKVGISHRGKTKRITLHEALYRRVLEDGLKGSLKSIAFLLARHAHASADPAATDQLSPDDQAIIEAFERKLKETE